MVRHGNGLLTLLGYKSLKTLVKHYVCHNSDFQNDVFFDQKMQ